MKQNLLADAENFNVAYPGHAIPLSSPGGPGILPLA